MNQNTSHVDEGGANWFGMSGREAWKEIAYGSIAGMVAEVFEYPFDLAKVRLQAQQFHLLKEGTPLMFKGPWHCLHKTWREEGLQGLYRGLSVPLVGLMIQTAGLFLAYSSFQHAIQRYQHGAVRFEGPQNPPITIPQLTIAAAGAGLVTSFILTPMELVKCRIQVQMMNIHAQTPGFHPTHSSTMRLFSFTKTPTPPLSQPAKLARSSIHNLTTSRSLSPFPAHTLLPSSTHSPALDPLGPITIARSIFQNQGLKGFWLGQTGTIFRETGGCAVWFAVKEVVAAALQKRRRKIQAGKDTKIDLLPWESATSGAMAGGIATLLFYPADTLKSVIQTEEEPRRSSPGTRPTRPTTFWRAALKMYRAHGFRGFYAGCGMTVARSVPSSGIIFVVYDGLRQWFA